MNTINVTKENAVRIFKHFENFIKNDKSIVFDKVSEDFEVCPTILKIEEPKVIFVTLKKRNKVLYLCLESEKPNEEIDVNYVGNEYTLSDVE